MPGEVLREDFLVPRGISMYRLAKAIGRPQSAVFDIVHGRRAVTPEMSCLMGAALGVAPEYFANLETAYQVGSFDSRFTERVELLA